LRLTNIDDNLVREIDDVLQKNSDREEILRKASFKKSNLKIIIFSK